LAADGKALFLGTKEGIIGGSNICYRTTINCESIVLLSKHTAI